MAQFIWIQRLSIGRTEDAEVGSTVVVWSLLSCIQREISMDVGILYLFLIIPAQYNTIPPLQNV